MASKVYTVHKQRGGDPADAVFIKEGIAWLALLAPIVWLLYHRLWLASLVLLALSGAIVYGVRAAGLAPEFASLLGFALNLLVATEGNDLRRAKLARKDWLMQGVVAARNFDRAERRWFRELRPDPAL